jgi:hypothetical protein
LLSPITQAQAAALRQTAGVTRPHKRVSCGSDSEGIAAAPGDGLTARLAAGGSIARATGITQARGMPVAHCKLKVTLNLNLNMPVNLKIISGVTVASSERPRAHLRLTGSLSWLLNSRMDRVGGRPAPGPRLGFQGTGFA